VIRRKLREDFYENLPILTDIIRSGDASNTDKLRGMDLQARFGVGTLSEVSTESVREKLQATARAIQELVPVDHQGQLLAQLREIWNNG
jgi:hypothetical protein